MKSYLVEMALVGGRGVNWGSLHLSGLMHLTPFMYLKSQGFNCVLPPWWHYLGGSTCLFSFRACYQTGSSLSLIVQSVSGLSGLCSQFIAGVLTSKPSFSLGYFMWLAWFNCLSVLQVFHLSIQRAQCGGRRNYDASTR